VALLSSDSGTAYLNELRGSFDRLNKDTAMGFYSNRSAGKGARRPWWKRA